jgi:hypothetical protein
VDADGDPSAIEIYTMPSEKQSQRCTIENLEEFERLNAQNTTLSPLGGEEGTEYFSFPMDIFMQNLQFFPGVSCIVKR